MWVSRHLQTVVERVGNELEQSRLEFERYRKIALEVESGRLTTNLLDETDLQSVLRRLRGAPMPLGWYYAFTPVKLVTISDEQIIFAADLWSRSKDTYEEWSLLAFPVRDQGLRKRTIVRSPIITDTKRQFVFQPSVCRGLSAKVCIISHVEKHACKLGLISGTPNECQLELTPRNVPFKLYPYRTNEWIIVPDFDDSQVTLRCDNRCHKHLVVTQVELWWVHPRCNIDTVNLTTHGVKSYHLDVIVNYEPPTILNVTFEVKDMITVEVPKLLTFHPQLEVQGIPHDILSDLGIYPVYNPHHVTYGLSALMCGVILVRIISVICVWKKCTRRPSKNTARLSSSDRSPRRSKSDSKVRTHSAKWSANNDKVTFSFACLNYLTTYTLYIYILA